MYVQSAAQVPCQDGGLGGRGGGHCYYCDNAAVATDWPLNSEDQSDVSRP